jgi:NAD+ kinase
MKNFYLIVSENDRKSSKRVNLVKNRVIEALKKYDDVNVDVHEGFLDRGFKVPRSAECVITIGGDGTMLRAARAGFGGSVLFLGINRGHMGYLTEVSDISNYDEFAARLVNNEFSIQERMMLSARADRNGKCIYKDFALNDVLLCKSDTVKMMEYEVYVNDVFLNSYRADGFLVSSPTGSTGYSMSAGGPIADPKARLLILTPICPHSINTRSMVLSAEEKIRIIPKNEKQLVSCDGADATPINSGDVITVTRSRTTMKFIKFKETSFLDTLRERMRTV